MAEIVTTSTSKQFSLNLQDALKGLILAALSAAITALYTGLTADPPGVNWKAVGLVAATSALGYLIKNFFSESRVVVQPPPDRTNINVTVPKPGETIKQSV